MKYLKPFTTLGVGIVIGYLVVPKILSRVG
jgi:hypothetical protein